MGSSPRIRGKCPFGCGRETRRGIIPANTGKIQCGGRWVQPPGDHPREYGENPCAGIHPCIGPGSSPRIRGKSFVWEVSGSMHGIIPANTGKILMPAPGMIAGWDHPREYGENYARMQCINACLGSSPRIRGKCLLRCGLRRCCRIIPANTGKIAHFPSGSCWNRDHPREYGENGGKVTLPSGASGSSPRSRGKLV